MLTVIEDCSPYYIRFTHPGIEELVEVCQGLIPDVDTLSKGFTHFRIADRQSIINLTPVSKLIPLCKERVSLFISKPGLYYRAHKDGLFTRFGINYTIRVLDDKCVTSWYSDADLVNYKIDNLESNTSRECIGFDKKKHTPLKSMTARQGEGILFNTEIFHDWDNSNSPNSRVVLTLRIEIKLTPNIYFDDAKKILFNI
jgi:hypothetical protein